MIIADTNEFHPLVDAAAYRDAREPDGTSHPVVIMRATYGTAHVDLAYAASVARARGAGLLIGHYGYLVAGLDAAAQGRFLAQTVTAHGGLRAGDTIWCDAEEGTGDQAPRVLAFLSAAHAILRDPAAGEGAYSGAAFWQAHLGTLPSGVHRWVAAYGQGDPALAGENLWQFTDARVMAGIQGPCDASIYLGTLADFRAMTTPAPAPSPQPSPAEEADMIMVQPARELVPAGTAWPGVFLLAAGKLKHIEPTVTTAGVTVSNVAAYQKAGVKGPVDITWEEYLSYGA